MNYNVAYINDNTMPYYWQKKNEQCRHILSEQYIVPTLGNAKTVIQDILDAPIANLSLEEIKKDFSSSKIPISEEKAKQIQCYYNGRLSILQQIMKDLSAVEENETFEKRYDIPQEYNEFVVDSSEEMSTQHAAYISISTTEVPI